MPLGGDDIEIDTRVTALVERGLERYGHGDLEGALSEWKHALVLDPDNALAEEYIGYIEKHYELRDKGYVATADPAAEHAVPFGIDIPRGLSEDELDAYESIEIIAGEPVEDPGGDGEDGIRITFSEFEPTRDRSREGRALAIEDGWAVEETFSAPARGSVNGAFLREETTAERAPESLSELELELELETDQLLAGDLLGGPSAVNLEPETLDIDLPEEPARPPALLRPTMLGVGAVDGTLSDARADSAAAGTPTGGAADFDLLELELEPTQGEDDHAADAANDDDDDDDDRDEEETLFRQRAMASGGDDEQTAERGSWRSPPSRGRAPTEDPAIEIASVQVDERLLSFEDATSELDIRDLARAGVAEVGEAKAKSPAPEPGAHADRERAEALLAEVDVGAPSDESFDDRLRRRVHGLIARATADIEAGRTRDAVIAAEMAVSESATSAVVQKAIAEHGEALLRIYRSFLGDLTLVPTLSMPMSEIAVDLVDHRAAFLLSRVDGSLSLDDILDVSGMPRLEALRHLSRLLLRGILAFH